MEYDVFRLFRQGVKLSAEEAKAVAPVTGELTIGTIRNPPGSAPRRIASLIGGTYSAGLIRRLDDCVVAKFNAKGEMIIVGSETIIRKPVYKDQSDMYPQQWVCKPVDPTIRRR